MAEFTEEELAAAAVTADDVQQQDAPQTSERPRDDLGRFAPTQEEEVQEGDQRQRESKVPHAALHAERENHKQTKAALQAAQEQLQRIAEMRARIMQAKPEEPGQTQAEDDPTGVKYLATQLEQLRGTVHQREQADQSAALESREHQVLSSQLVQSEAEFRQQTPDYDQAASYLANARAAELQMYGLQPHEIQQQLQEEVLEITRSAITMGRSPAELAYAIAKTRGYSGQQQNSGQAMLDAIAQGQKSRSLSSARGGGGQADPNAAAIAAMDEAEFERLYRSDPQFRQIADRLG